MEVEFEDDDLDRLETDGAFTAGFAPEIVRAYRRRMQQIRASRDERDLYASKGINFEKLKGDRVGQYSLRLNLQWRLIVKLKKNGQYAIVAIVEIVDYH